MKKNYIVLFIADQYSFGGGAQALLEIVSALKKSGRVNPIVATAYNNALADELSLAGINHVFLGYRQFAFNYPRYRSGLRLLVLRPLYFMRYYFANRKAIRRAERLIDKRSIDIIHSNVNRNDIGGVLARKWGIPHIWNIREYTDAHFYLVFNQMKPYKYMDRLTDIYVAMSNAILENWVQKGIDKRKAAVIYEGADISKIKTKEIHSDNKICKIVCVGEITENKGQMDVLQALSMIKDPEIRFVMDFYGNGSLGYINVLKKYADENGLHDKVYFLGYSDSLDKILADYDIAINPSKNEGFGRTTIEYMAAGLCVIAHNSGATSEIINENNGFLYNNVDELTETIKSICRNFEMRVAIGSEASEISKKNFNINNNALRYLDIYKSVSEHTEESS